jgi:hypothetical protein
MSKSNKWYFKYILNPTSRQHPKIKLRDCYFPENGKKEKSQIIQKIGCIHDQKFWPQIES